MLSSSDRVAIARNQVQESFSGYSFPRLDPLLEADLLHGWMFSQVVKWDKLIYGRWDYWIDHAYNNIKLNQSQAFEHWAEIKRDIPKIEFLEPDFTYPGCQMLKHCLYNIPHPRVSDRRFKIEYFEYLVNWILFGLGDKNCTELPEEPEGCDGASNRLFQLFSVPHFMSNPCDYLGDFLEAKGYLRKGVLHRPELIREVKISAILKASRNAYNPEHLDELVIDDLEILTGRTLLELSNYVHILSGLSHDRLLAKCALINGYFFAPWICKHLSQDIAAIYYPENHEEISTQICETEIARLTALARKDRDLVGLVTGEDFYNLIMMGRIYRAAS